MTISIKILILFLRKANPSGTNSKINKSYRRAVRQLHLMLPKRLTKQQVHVTFLRRPRDLDQRAKSVAPWARKAFVILVQHWQSSLQNFKNHPRSLLRNQSRSPCCLWGIPIITIIEFWVNANGALNASHLSSRERSRVKLRIKLSQKKAT